MHEVEPAAACLFLLATANGLTHAILLQSAEQAYFLAIMAMAVALLAPSFRVQALALSSQAAAAAAIALTVSPHGEPTR